MARVNQTGQIYERPETPYVRYPRWRPDPLCQHQVMAFDEELAARVQAVVADEPGLDDRRMFGGIAFLIGGHMAVAVSGSGGLMVRLPREETDSALALPHAGPMEMSRGPVKGWVLVDETGLEEDEDLRGWVARGVAYARSLPPRS